VSGEIVIVGVALLVGCVAIVFAVVRMFVASVSWVCRVLFGHAGRAGGRTACGVCPNLRCGRLESRPAVFCPRCGARLRYPAA